MARSSKRKDSTTPAEVPHRYSARDRDGRRVLVCSESPNISVHVDRGVTATESSARKAGQRSIFLDGAAQAPPFLDNDHQIYNLDHHEGVVRAFTLATCEQALVLVLRGMELAERNWEVFANEPDLDTVLSIWLLLNHNRMTEKNSPLAEQIIPLVRIEGAIDALGLDMVRLCGYSQEKEKRVMELIQTLREEEVKIKREGRWDQIDFADYTADLLHKIDTLVYRSMDFKEYRHLEELARVEGQSGSDVVFFRSELGIYELEQYLTGIFTHQPGIIVLQKNESTYTLRQVDLFSSARLEKIYARLNFQDPAVRSADNLWGGSGDIGGSPRATGTRLSVGDIAEAVRRVLHPPTLWQHATNFISAAFLTALVFIPPIYIARRVEYTGFLANFVDRWFYDSVQFYYPVALLGTVLLVYFLAGRRSRTFGWALPAGREWYWLVPGVILAGVLGGLWVPELTPLKNWYGSLFAAICLPLAGEVLFRGYLYGALARRYPCMHVGGEWFLSTPAITAALLYAVVTVFLPTAVPAVDGLSAYVEWFARVDQIVHFAGAFLFGLLAGMARERSGSLLGPLVLHLCGGVSLFAIRMAF